MYSIGIIRAGNVLGYSDNNPLPTNSMDLVDIYNKMAINTPIAGRSELMATLDRFRSQHCNQYVPMSEFDNDPNDGKNPLSLAMDDALFKRSEPVNIIERAPLSASKSTEPMNPDVAEVMAKLADSIFQG